jgi:replicative DNA helicase
MKGLVMIEPPANLSIEESSIGCLLCYPETFDIFQEKNCDPMWFFFPELRLIFETVRDLSDVGLPVSLVSVIHKLEASGDIAEVGGVSFVESLIEKACIRAHLNYNLDVLQDLYWKRDVILPAIVKAASTLTSTTSAPDVISELSSNLDKLETSEYTDFDPAALKALISARREEVASGCIGVNSRWKSLQYVLGGYRRGKVCLYGARTSVGKTTIALNEMRYHVALKKPTNVGFFSLETDIDEVYEQIAAEHIGLDLHKYAAGKVTDKALLNKFEKAIDWYCERPLFVIDKGMDIDQICFNIKYMARKRGMELCFIDFFQIIRDNHVMQKMHSTRNKMSYVSKRLFSAFRDSNVAGVVLTQLRRDADIPPTAKAEDRWKHIPQLHHLKETGSLEEDAYQVILFCHDPDEVNPKSVMKVDILANVLKNKRGITRPVWLTHIKNMQRIVASDRS